MKNDDFDLIVYADGGARGNPGEAAYGFIIYDKSLNLVYKEGKKIGYSTNNVAEYSGVIAALNWIKRNCRENYKKVKFNLDSLLAVSQLNGKFKVKNENIRNLFFTVKQLEQDLKCEVSYYSIPREENKEADRLVNMALDGEI